MAAVQHNLMLEAGSPADGFWKCSCGHQAWIRSIRREHPEPGLTTLHIQSDCEKEWLNHVVASASVSPVATPAAAVAVQTARTEHDLMLAAFQRLDHDRVREFPSYGRCGIAVHRAGHTLQLIFAPAGDLVDVVIIPQGPDSMGWGNGE